MDNTTINTTERPVTEAGCFHADSMAIKVGRIVPYCFIIPMSLIGNSLVLAVVARERRMRKTVNFFIANMSVADILATVVYMPRVISLSYAGYEWQVGGLAGLIFCKTAVCFNQTSIAVTIFTVIAVSLDRFFAVVFPLRQFITSGISQVIIAFTWIASLVATFPQFYGIKTRLSKGKLYCFLDLDKTFGKGSETAYYLFTMLGLFAVPLTTIVILYSGIMYTLIQRRNGIQGESISRNNNHFQQRERTRKKVLKMVSIVVAAFVLCWLLYFIQFILYSYGVILPCSLMYLRLLLAHFNSAINPCIYYIFNENFRRGFQSIFTGCGRCCPASCAPGSVMPFPTSSTRQPDSSNTSAQNPTTARVDETFEDEASVIELPHQVNNET